MEIKTEVPVEVCIGDEFQFSITINRKAQSIQLQDELNGFKLNYGPGVSTLNNTSISNGVVTKAVYTTFTYSLTAKRKGVLQLPATRISCDSLKVNSDPVSIKVIECDTTKRSGKPEVFARLLLSGDTVYKQEPLIARWLLYSNHTILSVNEMDLPHFDNFLQYEINDGIKPETEKKNINGKTYNSVVIKTLLLYPAKSGEYTIGKTKMKCKMQKADSKPYDFFSHSAEMVTVYTDSMKLTVKDFHQDIPDDFSHISGENIQISVSMKEPKVEKNKSFTLEVIISGNGNLKLLDTPKIDFPKEVKILNTRCINDLQTGRNGITGTRTFLYDLLADSSGKLEIPSFSLNYFDLKSDSFQQVSSNEIYLEVVDGDANFPAEIVPNDRHKKDEDKLQKLKNASFIVLDLSSSMLAQDFSPNRKTAILKEVAAYLHHAQQNVGLIVYSSIPQLLYPVSASKDLFPDSLNEMDSLMIGDGTSTGMALSMAIDKLRKLKAGYKSILLITDGESNKGTIKEEMAVEFSNFYNIPINIIGVGADKEYAPITIKTAYGEHTTSIPININDEALAEIALSTGGRYYRAIDADSFQRAIFEINKKKNRRNVLKIHRASSAYTEEEIQGIFNLMYQDIEEQKEDISAESN